MLSPLKSLLKSEIDPAFAKRAQLIFEEIVRRKPKRILDAGCGRGFYVNALSRFKFPEVIGGLDINQKYLKIAKKHAYDKRVKIKQGNLYSLPYPDNYFNFIIASEILEHLSDDKRALSELKRVLKKGGVLIITVPHYHFPLLWDPLNWLSMRLFKGHVNKNIWWLAGIWADHDRLYTQKEIEKTILETGLTIEKSEKVISWCWPFSHFFLYGVGKNLVERFGWNNFSRFDFNQNKRFSRLMATLFVFPSNLLDNRLKLKSATNIVIVAKK